MDPEKPIDTDQANAELRQMAELLRKARGEMEQFGFVTAETSKKLEEMQKQTRFNEMWGKKWQIVAGATATAAVDLGSALYKGQTGALASAKALSNFATTVGDAASTLALLMPGGWVTKGLVFFGAQLFKIGGKAVEEMARVQDNLYTAFYKLRNVGATTEEGMSGLAGRMVELNYGLEEMDTAVALIANNSRDLAAFGGTVGEGTKALSEFAFDLRKNNEEQYKSLRRIYGLPNELNKRLAFYIGLQTQLGQKTGISVEGFDRMTRATDALTKAFGIQTEELDKTTRQNLQETAFRVFYQQLVNAGGDVKKMAEKLNQDLSAIQIKSPNFAAQLKAFLTQQYDSPEYAQLFQLAQLVGVDLEKERKAILEDRKTTLFDLVDKLKVAGDQFTRADSALGSLAKRTPKIVNEVFGEVVPTLLDLQGQGDLEKRRQDAAKSVDALTKSMDALTENNIRTRMANEEARNMIQEFIKYGIRPASKAMADFAEVTRKVIEAVTGNLAKSRQGETRQVPGLNEGVVPKRMPKSGTAGMLGYAAVNRNPGNLRFAGQEGAARGEGGFAAFESVDEGLVALAKQLDLYLTGKSQMGKKDTIASIISTYAPPGDNNDTETYIKQISDFMGKKPDDVLSRDPATIAKLMVGIVGKESLGSVQKGYNMRGGIQAAVAQVLGIDPSQVGKFQKGGISDGPDSGYMAMLHGLEAIVPLANNRSIPVSFREPSFKSFALDTSVGKDLPSISESINRQSQVLEQQLAKADAMLQALDRFANADQVQVMIDKLQILSDKMNTSNDINSRILQVSM